MQKAHTSKRRRLRPRGERNRKLKLAKEEKNQREALDTVKLIARKALKHRSEEEQAEWREEKGEPHVTIYNPAKQKDGQAGNLPVNGSSNSQK